MRNIAMIITYDGTAYHGFQRQKNNITIQEVIEDAIFKITGENVNVNGCGRTDAKVHAEEYLLSFKSETSIPAEKIPPALNSMLPCDISVKKAWDASENFHGRFSVKKKTYVYRINNGEYSPFLKDYTWHIKYPLDVEKMQKGAEKLTGTHDFNCFMASGGQVESTVRTMFSASVEKKGDIIEISLCADGFLYNMVRIITGTLVYVGSGKLDVDDITEIITSKDRTKAGITAPPQGLFMKNTEFED